MKPTEAIARRWKSVWRVITAACLPIWAAGFIWQFVERPDIRPALMTGLSALLTTFVVLFVVACLGRWLELRNQAAERKKAAERAGGGAGSGG